MQRSDFLSFLLVMSGINRMYLSRLAGPGFPVLAYHEISARALARHLKILLPYYRLMSLEDALEYQGPGDSRPPLVLTFDDGYRSWLKEVLPVLRQKRIPALFFPTVGFVDRSLLPWYEVLERVIRRRRVRNIELGGIRFPTRELARDPAMRRVLNQALKALPNTALQQWIGSLSQHLEPQDRRIIQDRYLSWDELRSFEGYGIEIGAHSLTHPILARLPDDRVQPEVADCKSRLEAELQRPVRYFAYPNGTAADVNAQVVNAVKQAGYSAALTCFPGWCQSGDDPYLIKRAVVSAGGSGWRLRATASGLLDQVVSALGRGHG